MRLADVVISTGGLGPTADDLTTETIAQLAGRRLILDTEIADRIRRMFEAMGRVMPENNLKQAQFPEGAVVIPNALGTAPGFRLDLDTAHGRRHLIVLPGVPREMKPMIEEQVLPWLQQARGSNEVYLSHTFQTFGISESALVPFRGCFHSRKLRDATKRSPSGKCGDTMLQRDRYPAP